MTSGEHKHCFCTVSTGGLAMCCRCGTVLGLVKDLKTLLMWERMGHERDRLIEAKKHPMGQTELPGGEMEAEHLPDDTIIRQNGKIATLRKARKDFTCSQCRRQISRGTYYREIVYGGAGLRNQKYPDRTHDGECLNKYLQE